MELSEKLHWKMLNSLAHELCHAVHPETQEQMTGFITDEGFIVSCAMHKAIACQVFTEALNKETDGNTGN